LNVDHATPLDIIMYIDMPRAYIYLSRYFYVHNYVLSTWELKWYKSAFFDTKNNDITYTKN
jgi:hypothetical protein